ncbi:MAG TPA: hypothetical protein VGI90_16405 [Steroidobacteraceae bacterium]
MTHADLPSRSILKRIASVLLMEILWFSLMAPLFPSNSLGFLIEAIAGLCVFLIVYGAAKAITRLLAREFHRQLAKFGAATIAVSVGIFIFLAAYEFRALLSDNFRYLSPH